MPVYLQHNHTLHTLELTREGDWWTLTTAAGDSLRVQVVRQEKGQLTLRLAQPEGGYRTVRAALSPNGKQIWVTIEGRTWVLTQSAGKPRGGAGEQSAGELRAPMPGQVRAVEVAEGDQVEKGQTLLVLEAMKMEIRIQAPHAGQVTRLPVHAGQTVERDALVAVVSAPEED